MFEANLKWNFCNLQHPTFVALIQDWKQGQDKPLYSTYLVMSVVPYSDQKIYLHNKTIFVSGSKSKLQ